jgi:hypothetical protein
LVRHYWVLAKLVITVLATGLLIMHQFSAVAVAAEHVLGTAAGALPSAGRLGIKLITDASLAILALLTTTALAVYKPPGLTSSSWRAGLSPGLKTLLAVLGAILIAAVTMHLTGLAGHGHGHT